MRALVFWDMGVDNPAFARILKELDIQFCACYQFDRGNGFFDKQYEAVPINVDIEIVRKKREEMIPIDLELLDNMSNYEQLCLDVLWRARRVYSSEYPYSYRKIKEVYYDLLRFWNDYLVSREIDAVILWTTPHVPSTYIPYAIAKTKNIPTMIMEWLPIGNKRRINYYLSDSVASLDINYKKRVDEYYSILHRQGKIELHNELEAYFEEYTGDCNDKRRQLGDLPDTDGKGNAKEQGKIKRNIIKATKYLRKHDVKRLINTSKYHFFKENQETKLRRFVEGLEEEPMKNEKYIIFPLHMQPEATSLPLAGYFCDQMLAIDIIAKSIPSDFKLYIKEHPVYWHGKREESMLEGRSIDFYKTIKSYDNIRIIRHDYSSEKLIKSCIAVATLRGTIGFEAIFRKKPVLIFSGCYYEFFEGVYRISSLEDCKNAIDKIINYKHNISDDDIRVHLAALNKYRCSLGFEKTQDYMIKEGFPKRTQEDIEGVANCIIRFWKDYYPNKNIN